MYYYIIEVMKMFNQQEYINEFIKTKYKTIKLRIRNDNILLLNKMKETDNINHYIISLILKDIYDNRTYHFINNEIAIDFEISRTMKDLINKAEEADILNDYGLYMNLADAIDSQGKKETSKKIIRESDWKKLTRRYCL